VCVAFHHCELHAGTYSAPKRHPSAYQTLCVAEHRAGMQRASLGRPTAMQLHLVHKRHDESGSSPVRNWCILRGHTSGSSSYFWHHLQARQQGMQVVAGVQGSTALALQKYTPAMSESPTN
jgi:hypothetical protein